MSQKVSRKSGMNEEKEKRQTDSPAKDVKKKTATDKEKQVTDKQEKQPEKPEKQTDKKQAEKSEKQPDKSTEKGIDKKEKTTEKRDTQGEISKEDGAKEEKITKNDIEEESAKPHQNGTAVVRNGVADVTNGTVSGDSDEDDVTLVIDDEPEQDEMFPELTYDDTSDTEGFELTATDSAPSRSLTRRSQPKDSKVLKLKEDAPASDRKLRSSDSPKPQEVKKPQESTKKRDKTENLSDEEEEKAEVDLTNEQDNSEENVKEQTEVTQSKEESIVNIIEVVEEAKQNEKEVVEKKSPEDLVEIEVVVEVEPEVEEEKEEPRKVDTNYSKSRVKVSPYRRSSRIADQTTTSMLANYTGNNTTMEMDITETSFTSEREQNSPAPDDSYLRGLRTIRARNSYKKLGQLPQLPLTSTANRTARSLNTPGSEFRPTAPVVGRKRRPDADRELVEQHQQHQLEHHQHQQGVSCKRMRLLDRIAHPFRRNLPHALSTPAPEIVGINTDLPLTAPVASADTFDPETLKATPLGPGPAPAPASPPHAEPLATPLPRPAHHHHHADSKRCSIV